MFRKEFRNKIKVIAYDKDNGFDTDEVLLELAHNNNRNNIINQITINKSTKFNSRNILGIILKKLNFIYF